MKLFAPLFLVLMHCTTSAQNLQFTIHYNDTLQTIHNIGASACWFSEEIGSTWPTPAKERMAELLFSKDVDISGQPKGIGLSAFRYNIGGGTAEQGDSSGIKDPAHRVECFQLPNGSYDWSKQKGYTWFLQKAKNYGVENLIAFVNTPPVHLTKNGLGYKLVKDPYANLQEDKYTEYANFLTAVLQHFDEQNLHFNLISLINEPQWDWSGVPGEAKQEGSPWTNEEIYKAVKKLNTSLQQKHLTSKILVTEAAMLNHLYAKNVTASDQAKTFWSNKSSLYIGDLSHATPYIAGHGYFSESTDQNLISSRRSTKDTIEKIGKNLQFWQSEYCLLGDGFKEGTKGKRSATDCALFLAKVIHHDLALGNATAWQFWNSFEPGAADTNTLYYLVALNKNRFTDTANRYSVTKNLWALGHYSLFVRPGMKRMAVDRNDGLTDSAIAQNIMITAFRNNGGRIVVNAINYTVNDASAVLQLEGIGNGFRLKQHFVTSGKSTDNLTPHSVSAGATINSQSTVVLPARSINTFVFEK